MEAPLLPRCRWWEKASDKLFLVKEWTVQYALWDKKEIKIQFAESQHSRWVFFQHKMSFSIYFQCKTTDIDIANSMFTFNPTYSNDECCYSKTNISFLLNSQQVGWAGQCLLWRWDFWYNQIYNMRVLIKYVPYHFFKVKINLLQNRLPGDAPTR